MLEHCCRFKVSYERLADSRRVFPVLTAELSGLRTEAALSGLPRGKTGLMHAWPLSVWVQGQRL
jgi:hypothetical protein